MNYVKSLKLLDVEARQLPCIPGSGAPTTETVGAVGELYMDTETNDIYKCVSVNNGSYVWVGFRTELSDYATKVDVGDKASLSESNTFVGGNTFNGFVSFNDDVSFNGATDFSNGATILDGSVLQYPSESHLPESFGSRDLVPRCYVDSGIHLKYIATVTLDAEADQIVIDMADYNAPSLSHFKIGGKLNLPEGNTLTSAALYIKSTPENDTEKTICYRNVTITSGTETVYLLSDFSYLGGVISSQMNFGATQAQGYCYSSLGALNGKPTSLRIYISGVTLAAGTTLELWGC